MPSTAPSSRLLLLVDLDGVLYRGADPVPGVAALLATRAAQGDDVVYVTNNSMWHHTEYVDRIAAMGAPADPDRIVASPRATALYLRDHEPPIRPVLATRPGAGSIVAAVEAATGVTPISIGKPEPYLLEEAARAVGREASEAIMIGDGLGTDVAAARAVGARSVLMLTGVTTREA